MIISHLNFEYYISNGKAITPRKKQIAGYPVFAHPLGRKAARLTRPNIPIFRIIYGRPRPPGLRSIEYTKPALKTHIVLIVYGLTPQISSQAGIVANPAAITFHLIYKHRPPFANIFSSEMSDRQSLL